MNYLVQSWTSSFLGNGTVTVGQRARSNSATPTAVLAEGRNKGSRSARRPGEQPQAENVTNAVCHQEHYVCPMDEIVRFHVFGEEAIAGLVEPFAKRSPVQPPLIF